MLIGIDASRANEEQKTGVGWYAYFLICELKKHLSTLAPEHLSTLRVILYTNTPLRGELANLPEGWEERVLNWKLKRFWTQIRLSWEMLVNPPDVLFIPAHVFPIIHPQKTIMTIHDVAALKFPESYNWFEKWYTIWSARFALNHLWRVIAPSEFTKSELKKTKKQKNKKTPDNVFVVSHGYDERYCTKRNKAEIEHKLNQYHIEQPYLLSIGRLEHKKNTVKIIEAFNKIKFQVPSYKLQLVLVGQPGHGYHEVHQAIVDSPFKNDIITPGWVSEEDLPDLMQGAEVFVFPSLYEGFGMPILEAMASGVPVVASKGSGSASITTASQEVGGEACLYIDPLNVEDIANKILELLQNQELRKKEIELGLERVKNFGWEKCAGETFKILTPDSNNQSP